jgi:hypothetical protein
MAKNEYQEYFLRGKGGRCVGLTSPPSRVDCLELQFKKTAQIQRYSTITQTRNTNKV